MERRAFVVGTLGLVAGPLVAEAQQAAKVARIGYLSANSPPIAPHQHEAFLQGLRDFGYVEGRNLVIEYRSLEFTLGRTWQNEVKSLA
jgi:putative ABC transport system substrate-binding protein